MKTADESLLVFLRFPEPGKVKTRLIPRLGPEGAADLYRRMAERTIAEARRLERSGLARAALLEPPERVGEARAWIGPGFEVFAQAAGDLGARLAAAFDGAFAGGARRAVAIGTDSLDVTAEILGAAFDGLARRHAVLGPAIDGGYYLIGLARSMPEVFEHIPWSTERVLEATKARLGALGASVRLLEPLRDLDTPEDLDALRPRWGGLIGGGGHGEGP